jgi:hypothetical protein
MMDLVPSNLLGVVDLPPKTTFWKWRMMGPEYGYGLQDRKDGEPQKWMGFLKRTVIQVHTVLRHVEGDFLFNLFGDQCKIKWPKSECQGEFFFRALQD